MKLASQSSTITGAYCNMQFQITPTNAVPSSGGYLEIYLPKWNPGTQNINLASSSVKYSSSDFSSLNSGYLVDCSATGHANLKCIFIVNTPSSLSTLSTTTDTLRVTGFSSNLAGGSVFTLLLSNSRFRNPYSLKPLTTIKATTFNT